MSSIKFNYMRASGVRGTSADAGNWNSSGKPLYLEPGRVHLTDETIDRIIRSVPEKKPVPIYNPSYILDTTQRNLLITKDNTRVIVSFIHEGAGYRNVMGFYTYNWTEKHKQPTDLSEIASNYTIVFPNASYVNSGGDLTRGDRVDIGEFNAGTAIGFFLIPNGWDASSSTGIRSSPSPFVYSDRHLNSNNEVQTVLLQDEQNEGIILSFEDILRPSGDQDFNDLIIHLEVLAASATDELADVVEDFYNIPQLLPEHSQLYTGMFADKSGLYFSVQSLEKQVLENHWVEGSSNLAHYLLEHEIDLEDDTEDAAFMKALWDSIISTSFRDGESEVRSEPSPISGKPSLKLRYKIPTDRLRTFNYLVRSKENLDSVKTRTNGKTALENLVDLERQYVGLGRSERWTVQRSDEPRTLLEQPNSSVRSTLSEGTPIIWGDPHVRLASGELLTLPNRTCSFLLYTDVCWRIVAQMGPDPRAAHDENMRDACFIQNLFIRPLDSNAELALDAMNNRIIGTLPQVKPEGRVLRIYPDHCVGQFQEIWFKKDLGMKMVAMGCPAWVKTSREFCRKIYGETANVMCLELFYRWETTTTPVLTKDTNSFKLRVVTLPDRYGHWNQVEIVSPLSTWAHPGGVLAGNVSFEKLVL